MEDFIPTRVSKVKKDAVKDFVAFNYETPKKKEKKNLDDNDPEPQKSKQERNIDHRRQQELEMKRVRYEVIKFGMSGFKKAKATEAKVALAISLGAKPPKNKAVNYKVLQTQRKREKKREKRETQDSGLHKSLKKPKVRKTYKRDSTGILDVYGKVEKGRVFGKSKS